jgi:hypothetical protein
MGYLSGFQLATRKWLCRPCDQQDSDSLQYTKAQTHKPFPSIGSESGVARARGSRAGRLSVRVPPFASSNLAKKKDPLQRAPETRARGVQMRFVPAFVLGRSHHIIATTLSGSNCKSYGYFTTSFGYSSPFDRSRNVFVQACLGSTFSRRSVEGEGEGPNWISGQHVTAQLITSRDKYGRTGSSLQLKTLRAVLVATIAKRVQSAYGDKACFQRRIYRHN